MNGLHRSYTLLVSGSVKDIYLRRIREIFSENIGKTGTVCEIEEKGSPYKHINFLFPKLLCLMSALVQYVIYWIDSNTKYQLC